MHAKEKEGRRQGGEVERRNGGDGKRRWEEATPGGMGKLCEYCRPNFCQFWALHPCNPACHQMVALHYLPEMGREMGRWFSQ